MKFHTKPTLYRLLMLTVLILLLAGLAACASAVPAEAPAADTPAPATEAATNTPEPASVATTDTVTQTAAVTVELVPPPAEVAEGPASALEPIARNGMYTVTPEMVIDPTKFYYATLKTDHGDIKVQLFADRAPETVNNFVFLAREGYYNNTVFHRVLEGFMAQAGDPTGSGAGGPGYEFGDEIFPGLIFDRPGLLAMANRGPATNGSQFFITLAATDWLNGLHTIFGEVIEGQAVLDSLTLRDPQVDAGFAGDTLYTVLIEESDSSTLPTPTPGPPTPTPTQTPTPFAPSSLDNTDRPLAQLSTEERSNRFNTAPEVTLDTAKQYTATITTSQGDLVVSLYDDIAPVAVNNFVILANLGFYDGTPINQISPEAMVIGAPANVPTSDAGYVIQPEVNLTVTLDIGSVAYIPMAPEPGGPAQSSSSQLLIALIAPPAEVGVDFSFFGQIVDGVDLLPQLMMSDTIQSVTVAVSEE